MFKQAKQSRAFEDVILQIQEAILQKRLKEGDKLPSERNLRGTFKVSRYAPAFILERYRDPEYQKLLETWGESGQL